MGRYILRAEGVNFTETVLDTNNLAVLRGGSLALLIVGEEIEKVLKDGPPPTTCELIYNGASQSAWSLELDPKDEDRILKAARDAAAGHSPSDRSDAYRSKVLRHMRVVVDLARVDQDDPKNDATALAKAQAMNYRQQMRSLTLPLPLVDDQVIKEYGEGTNRPCPLDHTRPIGGTVLTERDRWSNHVLATENDGRTGRVGVSLSVADRMDYGMERGRNRRRQAYQREDQIRYFPVLMTDDFADLLQFTDTPKKTQKEKDFIKKLPESIKNKMAIIYMDGNGFTEILGHFTAEAHDGDSIAALNAFSSQVRDLRKQLDNRIYDYVVQRKIDAITPTSGDKRHPPSPAVTRTPMETIMWGADETMWIVPAWMAWDVLGELLTVTRDWCLKDSQEKDLPKYKLTQAIGVLTCHIKTPIRQACKLAKDIGESAKSGMKAAMEDPGTEPAFTRYFNALQIENLESVDIPDGHLESHRLKVLGTKEHQDFTMNANVFEELTNAIMGLKERFPRGHLYRALHFAVRHRAKDDENRFPDYTTLRATLTAPAQRSKLKVKGEGESGWEEDEVLQWARPSEFGRKHPVLPLALLAQLWDYVDPLDAGAGE